MYHVWFGCSISQFDCFISQLDCFMFGSPIQSPLSHTNTKESGNSLLCFLAFLLSCFLAFLLSCFLVFLFSCFKGNAADYLTLPDDKDHGQRGLDSVDFGQVGTLRLDAFRGAPGQNL